MQFEESLISYKMQQAEDEEEDEEPDKATGDDDGTDFLLRDDENDLDLRCASSLSLVLHVQFGAVIIRFLCAFFLPLFNISSCSKRFQVS